MEASKGHSLLFENIEQLTKELSSKHLADVFRFISFIPFERFEEHEHLRIEINYLKKGSCVIQLEDEMVHFKEGEMMLINPNVKHAFQAGVDGCTLMQLEFLPDIFYSFQFIKNKDGLSPYNLFTAEDKIVKIVNNLRIMRSVQRIVTELNTKSNYYQHLVVMYYAELLLLIYRHMDENYLPLCNSEVMKKAIRHIRQNYQQELSIKELAEVVNISERYLRKLFTQHLNLSPLDYINELRINKAIELLRITELSVKEVCYQCGFKSPQYFSRIFKQYMGVSPRTITK